MFRWFKGFLEVIQDIRQDSKVTTEMVYAVIPTTWIRNGEIRKRLVQQHPDLENHDMPDAWIYSRLNVLEARGMIKRSTQQVPKIRFRVGVCRKTGPGRPSHEIDTEVPVLV